MISDDLITGLRIGGIALFAWLWFRVMFESWDITEGAKSVRDRAWVYYRASIMVMCFTMVFLASPANILLANGYIDLQVNFWMMSGVTLSACLYAGLVHHGMDIATGKRPVTWISCALIVGLSAGFGVVKAI